MDDRSCVYKDHQQRPRCTECGLNVQQCECSDPDQSAQVRLWSEDGKMIRAIRGELQQHREAMPNTHYLMAGLVGAVGELMKTLVEQQVNNKTAAEVFHDSIKVATIAIRLGTEGDPDFPYEPYAIFGEEKNSF